MAFVRITETAFIKIGILLRFVLVFAISNHETNYGVTRGIIHHLALHRTPSKLIFNLTSFRKCWYLYSSEDNQTSGNH